MMFALLFVQGTTAAPPVWMVVTGLIVAVVLNTLGIAFFLWKIGYNVGLMAEKLDTIVVEVRRLREHEDEHVQRMVRVEAEIANLQRTFDLAHPA